MQARKFCEPENRKAGISGWLERRRLELWGLTLPADHSWACTRPVCCTNPCRLSRLPLATATNSCCISPCLPHPPSLYFHLRLSPSRSSLRHLAGLPQHGTNSTEILQIGSLPQVSDIRLAARISWILDLAHYLRVITLPKILTHLNRPSNR